MFAVLVLATLVFQCLALLCAAKAWDEHGLVFPNRTERNRYAVGMVIFSAAALLTAGAA